MGGGLPTSDRAGETYPGPLRGIRVPVGDASSGRSAVVEGLCGSVVDDTGAGAAQGAGGFLSTQGRRLWKTGHGIWGRAWGARGCRASLRPVITKGGVARLKLGAAAHILFATPTRTKRQFIGPSTNSASGNVSRQPRRPKLQPGAG